MIYFQNPRQDHQIDESSQRRRPPGFRYTYEFAKETALGKRLVLHNFSDGLRTRMWSQGEVCPRRSNPKQTRPLFVSLA
jgi:hypothetical protein